MRKISYNRPRFPPMIIQHDIWYYFRFPLSFWDVKEMLAERGSEVSYETARRWVLKFASVYNVFNLESHLHSPANFKISRAAALVEWRLLGAA